LDLEEKAKILEYIKEFDKQDKFRAISFCYSWNGTNGRYFNSKDPEDYLMEILAKMLDGKKCYTNSYKAFRGSVYYHLKNEMLSYFHLREDEINKGKNAELSFSNAENLINEDLYFESAELIYGGVELEEIKNKVFSSFDAETEVEEVIVLEEILKGGKRDEIAKALGIKPSDYTNILKRIKTKLIKRNTLINFQGN